MISKTDKENVHQVSFKNSMTTLVDTRVFNAIRNGDSDRLRELLEQGADPNSWLSGCYTNEAKAFTGTSFVFGGYSQLKTRDANPDSYRTTILHTAVLADQPHCAELLIEKGADVNAADACGFTALHFAIGNYARIVGYDTEIIKLLLRHGATIEAHDVVGCTPLFHAADMGKVHIAKLLFEHGADLRARDKYERTPLHLASSSCRPDMIQWLIANGANVDAQNYIGDTPLHRACQRNNSLAAEALIKCGANPKLTNCAGRTAEDLADDDVKIELCALFLQTPAATTEPKPGTQADQAIQHIEKLGSDISSLSGQVREVVGLSRVIQSQESTSATLTKHVKQVVSKMEALEMKVDAQCQEVQKLAASVSANDVGMGVHVSHDVHVAGRCFHSDMIHIGKIKHSHPHLRTIL